MNNMSFMIWFSVYACAMITLRLVRFAQTENRRRLLLGGRSLPMILTLSSMVTHGGDRLQRRRRRLLATAGPGCFGLGGARWGSCWWHGYLHRYVNFAS